MTRSRELNMTRLGAFAAVLMAISTLLFFAIFNALSTADPRSDTARFLTDASARQGLAGVVAWSNAWLGILTAPLYLGLYYALRRYSRSYMSFALLAGIAWGFVLIIAAPMMYTLLVYVAPTWSASSDSLAKTGLLNTGAELGWFINTTIGGTVFLLRAISVLAASAVMLLIGERVWTGLGWLGLVFGIEHIIAGTVRVVALGSGAAAGATLLGALGGVLLFVWLAGVGIAMWRLPAVTESGSHRTADEHRVGATGPVQAEHAS